MGARLKGYRSIKTRFISYIIQILFYSMLATIISMGIVFLLVDLGIIRRADYYDRMVPHIREYVYENGTDLLNKEHQKQLEAFIPKEGISYKVLDKNGDVVYQNDQNFQLPLLKLDENNIKNEQKTVTGKFRGKIIRYFPIVKEGELYGSVVIGYSILNSSTIPIINQIAPYTNLILLMLPFAYFILFIIIFSRKFIKSINYPLTILKAAIDRIQNNDLDFTIDYSGQDEIGYLCDSFEKMRYTLQETLELNWKKESERRSIISGLSHDLRTPVTVIKGYTEMLLGDGKFTIEQINASIKAIQRNTDRLSRLVEDINKVNKLEQLDFTIKKREVNLFELIEQKLYDYRVMCKEKEIEIKCDLCMNRKLFYIDDDAFIQILDNLISNSVRFTPVGGTIKIKLKEIENKLELNIEDSGIGFTSKDISHGFELFYQGDESRQKGQNYGIGLYIVYTLVNKMKGEINLYNINESGAGVKVILPLEI